MDWKQFVAAIVGSAAWPVAAICIILVMRKPLAKIIDRIQSFKYGEIHVDLAEKLDEVKVTVASDPSKQPPPTVPDPAVVELARRDPRSAVLRAWSEVERELMDLASKANIPSAGSTPVTIANELHIAGFIDETSFITLRKLRKIRNEAAHFMGTEVSFEEAISMANLCRWLASQLNYVGVNVAAGWREPFKG